MFETSVVQARAQTGGRLSLLTVSVIAHSAVVIGAIAMSIVSTEFPTNAPNEFALAPVFLPIAPPPPLGRPDGGAVKPQPAPQQKPAAAPAPQPSQLTAPPNIPETITNAEPAASPGTGTGDPSATSTEPLGVPGGVKDSAGALDAPLWPVATAQPEPEKIYEVHEVKPPVPLYKPQPQYPSHLIRTRLPATVVVRCVIDKNGRIRDPRIVVAAMPPFNKAVLDTIATWRYTPGSLGGVAVETYMDVTVNFAVN